MYQIKCDDYVLYDPRKESLVLNNPKCKLEVNKVGSASFMIYKKHPYYSAINKMRSIIEISQNGNAIFRGRVTTDTKDFNNAKSVVVEGLLAFFNDSLVKPFVFPDDFVGIAEYDTAAESGNVVEYFLKWLIDNHNAQTEDFQHFKLGNVTVSDKNNYVSLSSSDYSKTWSVIESKLIKGSLGGYFCIRYEEDGNYIDYLSDFELTNIQRITYGENLLDINTESSASETYSAVLPLGMRIKEIDEASDDESRLTIASLADGAITEDIIKKGDTIYSKSAVEKYGFIYAPIADTTFEDVSLADNLRDRGMAVLADTAIKLKNTIKITAVDLNFTDAEIEAFRIYRNIIVNSAPHEHESSYKLTALDIDILQPQNTKITLGDTTKTLTDINASIRQNVDATVQKVVVQTAEQSANITEIKNSIVEQSSSLVTTCEEIIMEAAVKFVETSNYETFTESVQAQFKLLADEIALSFTQITDSIENVNGDLQEKFNMITKYFTFDVDGLTIGQTDNPYKVVIDNDRYSMLVNGVEVLWLDGEGKAHIPEISVTRKMNLFGYLIEEDEAGNVNCEYVGGDA